MTSLHLTPSSYKIILVCFVYIVGNTDGLIKGKRYFTCPSKHGKVVRITSIVAILPNKVSHCRLGNLLS